MQLYVPPISVEQPAAYVVALQSELLAKDKYRGIGVCRVAADRWEADIDPAFDAEFYYIKSGEQASVDQLEALRDRSEISFASLPQHGLLKLKDRATGKRYSYEKSSDFYGEDNFVAKVSFAGKSVFVHYLIRVFDGMDRYAKESCSDKDLWLIKDGAGTSESASIDSRGLLVSAIRDAAGQLSGSSVLGVGAENSGSALKY